MQTDTNHSSGSVGGDVAGVNDMLHLRHCNLDPGFTEMVLNLTDTADQTEINDFALLTLTNI